MNFWIFQAILFGAFLLCCVLPFTKTQPSSWRDNRQELSNNIDPVKSNTDRIAAAMFEKFTSDSKSRHAVDHLQAISRWFPVSVDYSVTAARQCDVKNNREFYYLTPVIMAVQFTVLGFLLGFFGKFDLAGVADWCIWIGVREVGNKKKNSVLHV